MGQAGTAKRGPRARDGGVEEFVRGLRCSFTVAPSVHAIPNGGAVAPVAAEKRREIHCAGSLSGSRGAVAEPRRAGRCGADSGSGGSTAHDSSRFEARSEEK